MVCYPHLFTHIQVITQKNNCLKKKTALYYYTTVKYLLLYVKKNNIRYFKALDSPFFSALPATTEEIFHYHEKACDNDFNESCYSAALMYMDKDYVGENTNLEKCLKLFNQGCDQNDPRNCSKLGEIYRKGSHVEKDMIKSMNYHKKGCELQSIRSCYNLSIMFRNGDGVEQNSKLAEQYSNIAKKLYDDKCKASNLKMSQDV